MALKVERIETCVASLSGETGSLTCKLVALARARANLEFVLARSTPEHPGQAVVFVAPVKGRTASRAACRAGFAKTTSFHTVRFEGADKPGQGARITKALGDQGLNLRWLSATRMGKKFVAYIGLGSSAEAAQAVRILRAL